MYHVYRLKQQLVKMKTSSQNGVHSIDESLTLCDQTSGWPRASDSLQRTDDAGDHRMNGDRELRPTPRCRDNTYLLFLHTQTMSNCSDHLSQHLWTCLTIRTTTTFCYTDPSNALRHPATLLLDRASTSFTPWESRGCTTQRLHQQRRSGQRLKTKTQLLCRQQPSSEA